MARTAWWQLVWNNRLVRPFCVRDQANRTLWQRVRLFFVIAVLAIIGLLLLSNRRLNLWLNRDELENVEANLVATFYPAYDSLYYWLIYQGNLAEKLDNYLEQDSAGEKFLISSVEDLQTLESARYIQYGMVGTNKQWLASPGEQGWQVIGEASQDFSAWLLTQDLPSGQIYWSRIRQQNDELGLFWLYQREDGQKVYFLASVAFPYQLFSSVSQGKPHQGAVIFMGEGRGQLVYPLINEAVLPQASTTAELASDRAALNNSPPLLLEAWSAIITEKMVTAYQEKKQRLFETKLGGENYWVQLTPIKTNTGYDALAVVLTEMELLGRWGLDAHSVRLVLISILIVAALVFIFYYWDFSRRYYFINQIKDIMKAGESSRLEFKSSLRFDIKKQQLNKDLETTVLKSVAAFNNTDGGILVIGVDDEGQVLGLKDDYGTLKKQDKDGFELHLRALISQAYGQHFAARRVEIFFPVLEKKEVCVVKIKKGRSALYTDVTDKNGNKAEKFYIRMGNSSREIEKLSDIVDYQNQRFKWHWKFWRKSS
ncbi:putative DNA binding domain-containing protein [bacterium]|nr:putative DNA binding domain-containing protein [bacterium]